MIFLVNLIGQKSLSSVTCFSTLGRKSDKIRPNKVTFNNVDAKYDTLV